MFTNLHSIDCGSFVGCQLKAVGCINPYSGNVALNPSTFALTAKQNIDLGYDELLCV